MDVLGTSVRVLEIGLDERRAGSPVIVLESGGAEPLEQWRDWPVLLSKMAPVVAYDRAGLGESEWDGALPTPRHVAERLHALLAKIAVPPPYVLVGHSLGTDLIPGYTAAYPEEVAGEVHLDPTPEARPDIFFGTATRPRRRCGAPKWTP